MHEVVLQLLDPIMQQFREDRMKGFLNSQGLEPEELQLLLESMRKPERERGDLQ